MKKPDYYLIIVILLVTICGLFIMKICQKSSTENVAEVVVTIDKQEYGTYPLYEDRTERIELGNGCYNVLVIKDGYAEITEADCRDQICVHHMHIHYSGETIVCLPHKLIVKVVNGAEQDIDGATH